MKHSPGFLKLVDAAKQADKKELGPIVDTLYEAGTPAAVAAARRLLFGASLGRPTLWRYAKSVLKRSMLRGDAQTFGHLAHAIERHRIRPDRRRHVEHLAPAMRVHLRVAIR